MWADLRPVKYALTVLALTRLASKCVTHSRRELIVAGNTSRMPFIAQKNIQDLMGVAYVFLVFEDSPHQNNRAHSRDISV